MLMLRAVIMSMLVAPILANTAMYVILLVMAIFFSACISLFDGLAYAILSRISSLFRRGQAGLLRSPSYRTLLAGAFVRINMIFIYHWLYPETPFQFKEKYTVKSSLLALDSIKLVFFCYAVIALIIVPMQYVIQMYLDKGKNKPKLSVLLLLVTNIVLFSMGYYLLVAFSVGCLNAGGC